MTKNLIRRLVLLLVIFLGCTVAFTIQMNRSGKTYAAPQSGASLPVAYMQVEGLTVNPMTAYRAELREATERESLTPLSVDRSLTLLIDTMSNSIGTVGYQVTEPGSGKILENGELTEFEDAGGMLSASFTLRTTEIRKETEYLLKFTVSLGSGSTVYYYTRLVQYGAGNVASYLSFTNEFIENATDKVTAADLGIYMEPDDAVSNRSLAHITINNSTDMMSWSSLDPTIVQKTPPTIQEINDMNIGIRQKYIIEALDDQQNREYYTVEEYFRITEYQGQLIVRNYQRDTAQIFDPTLPIIEDSSVNLGIQERDIEYVCNAAANQVAFVVNGDLWLYDAMTDRITQLFTFRGKTQEEIPRPDMDIRTEFTRHGIRISNVEDDGSVTFVVYGYMSSGTHEGQMGILVCRYSAADNVVQEKLFLPLNQSLDLLERNAARLCYVGSGNDLYLFLDTQLCRIDLSNGSFSVVQDSIPESALMVSASQRLVAWTQTEHGQQADKLTLLNLATGKRREITPPSGQTVTGFGFIGEDISYGFAADGDTFYEPDGTLCSCMYTIRIEDEDGNLRKEYARDGVVVTKGTIADESLQLELAVRTEDGLQSAGTDHIRNNEGGEEGVSLRPVSNIRTDEQMWITFDGIYLQTDPEVFVAGLDTTKAGVETVLEWPQTEQPAYYIYAYGKLLDTEMSRKAAVKKAFDCYGGVLDSDQRYIWQRGSWPVTYRLDTNTMSPELLEAGSSGDPAAFEAAAGSRYELTDLSGTMTTAMFYWISRGCPVMGMLPNGSSYLMVGYTEDHVLVWDTAAGTVKEVTRAAADKQFGRAGYMFYTYEEKEEDAAGSAEETPEAS